MHLYESYDGSTPGDGEYHRPDCRSHGADEGQGEPTCNCAELEEAEGEEE